MGALIADMARELQGLSTDHAASSATRKAALECVGLLQAATGALLKMAASSPERALAVAVPYLKLCGFVIGGWLMAKSSAIAAANLSGAEREFYEAKIRSARFYAEQVLPNAIALARVVEGGATSVVETDAALV